MSTTPLKIAKLAGKDLITAFKVAVVIALLCGGSPCQGNSSAGKGLGLKDPRSALWFEYLRIVEEITPPLVVVENVHSGARRWLPYVRQGLHMLGYRTRAFLISAEDVGAPHLRRRVFVVAADPERVELRVESRWRGGANGQGPLLTVNDGEEGLAPTSHADGKRQKHGLACGASKEVTNPESASGRWPARDPDRDGESTRTLDGEVAGLQGLAGDSSHWSTPPVFRRVDDGLSGRLDGDTAPHRNRALGNAVVPQCAETIGRVIMHETRPK